MNEKKRKTKQSRLTKELKLRCGYTFLIMLIYLICRKIPIPWLDHANLTQEMSTFAGFAGTVFGQSDIQASILALGISPWMTSMILMQILFAIFRETALGESRELQSRLTKGAAICMAILEAGVRLRNISFPDDTVVDETVLRVLTILVLTAGSCFVIFLAERNERFGIGGLSFIVLINILSNLRSSAAQGIAAWMQDLTLDTRAFLLLLTAVLWTVLTVFLTLLFEGSEIRLPIRHIEMQREENGSSYLAVKANPIGTMAVMFSMSVFSLPYYLVQLLEVFFPSSAALQWLETQLNLNELFGLAVYFLILFLLEYGFSMLLMQPGDLADQLQESGDYIIGIRPGRDTRRLLIRSILKCCGLSFVMMSFCAGAPLVVRLLRGSTSRLYMMPITIMLLTGILYNVMDEAKTINRLNSYHRFF